MKPEIRNGGIVIIGLAVTIILACLLAVIFGCQPPPSAEPEPQPVALAVVDFVSDAKVDPDDRQGNWGPSCGWAAMCVVLTEHGLPQTALAWRANYYGATYQGTIEDAARESGLGFAGTEDGDMDFLRWCSDTNRKASVTWKVRSGAGWGGHRVAFYRFYDGRAYFVDVNSPDKMKSTPIEDFQRWWQWSGGDACTAYAYASQPPTPCKWEKFRARQSDSEKPAAPEAAGDRPGPHADRVAVPARRLGPFQRLAERIRQQRASRGR
ncbi:MAG TPA: hypothetical protein VMY42_12155 [Thermoguttaceae bacterium]|nr:hypothetical protein [Thermoguttaceae bacterium]